MSQEVYYRPPSEAESFIIRVMEGCPHNKCTFCNMFKDITCKAIPVDEIISGMEQDVLQLGPQNTGLVRSIYLEGGDPLALPTNKLIDIMHHAKRLFPNLERFACYATVKYTNLKTRDELAALHKAGLRTVYVGLESGSDAILSIVKKGCTTSDILAVGSKLAEAGIDLDVSMMLGIGGKEHSCDHAINTARLINAVEPVCVRIRTFIPKIGTELGDAYEAGEFALPGPHDTIRELRMMISELSSNTRILSEHWSNFVLFVAQMPEAKGNLLAYIDKHLAMPESSFRSIGIDEVRS